MASPPQGYPCRGRDFTAQELIGRRIRIEGPGPKDGKPPIGYAMMVLADGEMITNVVKLVLTIEPCAVVEAILSLGNRADWEVQPEEVALRDNIEVSFSAIASEVQDT